MENTTIIGNLGRDPELKYLPDGTPVCEFSLAVSGYKTTKWVRVSVFGKQAESCNQYLAKGRQAAAFGEYTCDPDTGGPRMWKKRDGSAGTGFEFRANTVKFLSGRNEEPSAPVVTGQADEPDDIPF